VCTRHKTLQSQVEVSKRKQVVCPLPKISVGLLAISVISLNGVIASAGAQPLHPLPTIKTLPTRQAWKRLLYFAGLHYLFCQSDGIASTDIIDC
jgi:hypothetical protein